MRNKVQQILYLCALHNIEIVSYGLAPNPNGFCYEIGDTPIAAVEELENLLDSLTKSEENMLKSEVF